MESLHIKMHLLVLLSTLVAVASSAIIHPHVVGGKETTVEERPYQASITNLGKHHCGAVIVSVKHVLTTGRCLTIDDDAKIGVENLKVLLGSTQRSKSQIYDVKETDIDFRYTYLNGRYALVWNIGVVTLARNIVSTIAQPIELVSGDHEPQPGEKVTVSGWGQLEGETEPTETLHAVEMTIMDRPQCSKRLSSYLSAIYDQMLCAGDEGQKDTPGDLGGPLVNSKNQLVGIASFGIPKYYSQTPSVYVNIANRGIRRFIIGIIRDL